MKRMSLLLCAALAAIHLVGCAPSSPEMHTVANDPMGVRIYTLKNGLTVYLSQNMEDQRIHAEIAVRVGSKDDPAETTGLSHYLEHLMFKGTPSFGTSNYEAEKPYLEQIESLYESYRQLTDPEARRAKYHEIDSISYLASEYLIGNEYDKLMSAIGSQVTNAYTSFDQTVYIENIPSNQVENWARIQADRFQNMVIRGFHTELEAVYEEKNISMDDDNSRLFDSLFACLFPSHPYGTQTTLGTQAHLQNPSIVNIRRHFDTYYKPNNIAICMSGNLDYDRTIAIIEKYFGGMTPNPDLPRPEVKELPARTEPRVSEVVGSEAAKLYIGWALPGSQADEDVIREVVSNILYNGQAGLLDLDLNKSLTVLESYATAYTLADHGAFILGGSPQKGQSLEELRDLLLKEVARLRNGDFDESVMHSIVENMRYNQMSNLESNRRRTSMMVDAFIYNKPWEKVVSFEQDARAITKEQVVAFANKYLQENNYAIVYKREGENTSREKIEKPAITQIRLNQDQVSAFAQEIQNSKPEPLTPEFYDFEKSITRFEQGEGVRVLLVNNPLNDLFHLSLIIDKGRNHSRTLDYALSYHSFLRSKDMGLDEFNAKMYSMAAYSSISCDDEQTFITVMGLSEHMAETLALVENFYKGLEPDAKAWKDFVDALIKSREDSKKDQRSISAHLRAYVEYGEQNPANNVLSNEELRALDPAVLVDEVKGLFNFPHTISVYTPKSQEEMLAILNEAHPLVTPHAALPEKIHSFVEVQPKETKIFLAHYESVQAIISQHACRGEHYDINQAPLISLFNTYFGGGMNSIVFQELRESRGLAYSAGASYMTPSRRDEFYSMSTYIGCQADKMMDAIGAFDEILRELPQSQQSFDVAKESIMAQLRASSVKRRSIIGRFLQSERMGLTEDPSRVVYERLPALGMADMVKFHEDKVKGNAYHFSITGDRSKLDLEALRTLGPVEELSLEKIFGY